MGHSDPRKSTGIRSDGWTLAGPWTPDACPHERRHATRKACYFRSWYEANRQSVLERVADWKDNNRGRHLSSKKRWRERHGERVRQVTRQRRARLAETPVQPYTEADVYELYGRDCYLCGRLLDFTITAREPDQPTLDHVVPIVRGGSDTLDNVRPAHRGCNSWKGRRLLSELST